MNKLELICYGIADGEPLVKLTDVQAQVGAILEERDAALAQVEQLKSAITTALRGTTFDEVGNRDDDGLIPFGNTKTAIEVLTDALCQLAKPCQAAKVVNSLFPSTHLKECKYHGVEPASMCPCNCNVKGGDR